MASTFHPPAEAVSKFLANLASPEGLEAAYHAVARHRIKAAGKDNILNWLESLRPALQGASIRFGPTFIDDDSDIAVQHAALSQPAGCLDAGSLPSGQQPVANSQKAAAPPRDILIYCVLERFRSAAPMRWAVAGLAAPDDTS